MLDVLVFIFWLLVIGLALFGALVLAALVHGPRETERQRIAREAREAERKIADIGRQAQIMILDEALSRVRSRGASQSPGGQGRQRPPGGRWDGLNLGPWDA